LLQGIDVKGEMYMACPDFGSSAGDFRFVTSVETHGLDCGPYETCHDEFIVCGACGGRFDIRDWEGTPEEAPSVWDPEDTPQQDCPFSDLPSESR
jgi:hypothetical protein